MVRFRELYDRLPEDDKDKIMNLLNEAVEYRGHDADHKSIRGFGAQAVESVQEIVAVFARNGVEFLELS